jgi:hypothetical protein
VLPTLHASQVEAYRMSRKHRRLSIRCGRRWGKTTLLECIAGDGAAKQKLIGYFAPDYKRLSEVFEDLRQMLGPILRRSSKTEGVLRTEHGGIIDFWTLEDEAAGRSRKYHTVLIDEAAFAKPNMTAIWERSIEPTLLDYCGNVIVASNTAGIDDENFFYKVCTQRDLDFAEYHAPTHSNPRMPVEELARLHQAKPPLVWRQEYLAEFVDWHGIQFFELERCLVNGLPTPLPMICDGVFAVVDTAVKAGSENDGTAVSYWATSRYIGQRLVCLDYDILQIEGSLLEHWIPNVIARTQELSKLCGSRMGSLGVFVENVNSGAILVQQMQRKQAPVQGIDMKLTSKGKDERALNVSAYVYQGLVKISEPAYNKIVQYKDTTRNHLLAQVFGFRLGDKDAAKRADDLLDTWCYAISIALGNVDGY